MLGHYLLQESKAVHSRHLDIESDNVGHFVFHALRRYQGIGRSGHNLYIRVRRKDFGHSLSYNCRIIDYQHPDFPGHLVLPLLL